MSKYSIIKVTSIIEVGNMDIIGAIGWALEKTWSFIVQLAMKIKELEVFQKMFQ